ncbi:hypothetical protein ILUMI_25441 [Ignelater luminosus]|uniref:Uncharacterized protein n=1 Tax=Ignelater luminosus TaxID=2038154 RepID=A0A8K0C7E4_IGNLU|nr:hypothetical protein ILUMI_25441 [Ignelater luminosus]
MAIPFLVEDDSEYEEALLQQLYSDLFHTIQQIELIQRSRRAQHQISPRVRTTPSAGTSRRNREVPGDPLDSENLAPEPVVNLALALSPAGSQNDLDAILRPQNLSTPTRRRRRRRTRSEPSCCEENKPVKVSVSVEVTNKEWNQQEKSSQSSPDKQSCGSESLLSKLVPAPFSGPLWTAVICVVGWHLLRTR